MQCRSREPDIGACMKSISKINTMHGCILTDSEKSTLIVDSTYILTKLIEREMKVNGTVSWGMLEEYIKDNYYARFNTAITNLT